MPRYSLKEGRMKVIGINSSPKLNGNTGLLVRAVLEGAAKEGASTEEIFLPDLNIEFCRGCFVCMSKGICPITDDFNSIKEKIVNAGGFVLGTPTYGFSPNAMMKRFLERFGLFEYMTSSAFGGKYLVCVATTGGQGAEKVNGYLTSIVKNGIFGRTYISGTIAVGTIKQPVAGNEKVLNLARETGRRLAADIRSKNTYPLQNLLMRIVTRLFIQPTLIRSVKRGKDGWMKAVYVTLAARGIITAS